MPVDKLYKAIGHGSKNPLLGGRRSAMLTISDRTDRAASLRAAITRIAPPAREQRCRSRHSSSAAIGQGPSHVDDDLALQ